MSSCLKSRAILMLFVLPLSISLLTVTAEAQRIGTGRPGGPSDRDRGTINQPVDTRVTDDSDLVRAVHDRRNVRFVEAVEVTVSRILSDDVTGLEHQRWYVRLSNGEEVFCVYNLDMSGRVPIQVGTVMNVGGEFKWTNQGALLHWLHRDPKQTRPDGYVEVGGVRYGTH